MNVGGTDTRAEIEDGVGTFLEETTACHSSEMGKQGLVGRTEIRVAGALRGGGLGCAGERGWRSLEGLPPATFGEVLPLFLPHDNTVTLGCHCLLISLTPQLGPKVPSTETTSCHADTPP